MQRPTATILMAAALAALAGCDITGTAKSAGVQVFTTAPVSRGSVVQSVSATGTVEPEELVDIGAQVSGKILSFGRGLEGEELDYCSQVTNGMLLAKIDDVTYVADLNVAEAQLRRARESRQPALRPRPAGRGSRCTGRPASPRWRPFR